MSKTPEEIIANAIEIKEKSDHCDFPKALVILLIMELSEITEALYHIASEVEYGGREEVKEELVTTMRHPDTL